MQEGRGWRERLPTKGKLLDSFNHEKSINMLIAIGIQYVRIVACNLHCGVFLRASLALYELATIYTRPSAFHTAQLDLYMYV